MFCKNCGRKQEDGERFCANCGTEYESSSPTCSIVEEDTEIDGEEEDSLDEQDEKGFMTWVIRIAIIVAVVFFFTWIGSDSDSFVSAGKQSDTVSIDTELTAQEEETQTPEENNLPSWIVGSWYYSTHADNYDGSHLVSYNLVVKDDGSGYYSVLDHGIDGLLMREILKIPFSCAKIYGDELWLCSGGRTMAQTPKLKIIGATIMSSDGKWSFKKDK